MKGWIAAAAAFAVVALVGAAGTVALDKFGQPIGELVAACKATPKETLWQKIKSYL